MSVQHESTWSSGDVASAESSTSGGVAGRVGQEAGSVGGAASEGVREVADELSTQARVVAGQAREQLQGLIGQAREEFGQQAQQRSEQTAGQLRTLSEQLVALAEGRPESAGSLAGLLYDAEGRVRNLATRLEQRGPQGVSEDLSRFARRRPGLFLTAAVGAGFVLGRVVRAGSSARQGDGAMSGDGQRPEEVDRFGEGSLVAASDGPSAVTSGITP